MLVDAAKELEQAEARLRAALRDPEGVQERLLLDIVTTNRDTVFGREYDFASIEDLATYRKRVPIVPYSAFTPYMERICDGEPDVLFAGRAVFIGTTTGTTSEPKLIGFNSRVRNEYVHMLGPIVSMLERDYPGASRTSLLLTARYEETTSKGGIPIGAGSGWVRRCLDEHPYFRFAPEPVYETRDAAARMYTFLLLALMRPMRCFVALFPTLLTNMFRRAAELVEPLADDLERGTMHAGPPGLAALALSCAPRLRPMPAQARRIRDIVRANGRFVPSEYWTDVNVLQVWKAGTAKHGLAELQAIFPRAEIRPMITGSTEASLMVPLDNASTGGVPALCSTVIDYLPVEAPLDASEVVTLRDLQEGHGYRLVVTNHRGLYRYVMDDVFFIEGYVDGVPSLRIDHRLGIVSSLTGEKMKEEHVSHAIDAAIAATGARPNLFQVAPRKTGDATFYVIQAEFPGTPSRDDLRRFVAVAEREMGAQNESYALFRSLGVLGPLRMWHMRQGYFDAVFRARADAQQGRADLQLKLVALSPALIERDDAALLDEIELDR